MNLLKIRQDENRQHNGTQQVDNRRSFGNNLTNLCVKRVETLRASSFSFTDSIMRIKSRHFKSELQQQIFTYFLKIQKDLFYQMKSLILLNYGSNITKQGFITYKKLINLAIKLQQYLQLNLQTLHLSFSIITKLTVNNQLHLFKEANLELIAFSTLWLACKYNQNKRNHRLRAYSEKLNNKYKIQDILFFQSIILENINYNFCQITINAYIGFFQQKINIKKQLYQMVCFLSELAIYFGLNFTYSENTIFFSAVVIAEMIYKQITEIRKFRQALKLDGSHIVQCMKDLCNCLRKQERIEQFTPEEEENQVLKKYSKQQKCCVSRIKLQKIIEKENSFPNQPQNIKKC